MKKQSAKSISFRLVETSDAGFILSLRQDESLNKYISKTDVSVKDQEDWIQSYKLREKNKKEFYFIIVDNDGTSIGTVRLYDFKEDKNSFSWGSWIVKPKSPRKAAIESAILVYEFAFFTLNFDQCHFQVDKNNCRVVAFHQRFGAIITSEDKVSHHFILSKEDYIKRQNIYLKLINK